MKTESVEFTGHNGDKLAARLDLPDGPLLATALFAHCFTCSKESFAAKRISARLTGAGIAVLRFDFTGLGGSEGAFADTTFSSNVADLIEACAYLKTRGMEPSMLIGHSLGGAAVLKAGSQKDNIKAVVTLGAPYAPDHVTHNFADHLQEIMRDGVAEVDLGGRPFCIGKEFLDDISAAELEPAIHNLRAALLVMHAPLDQVVGIENAQAIFTAAKHPKSFVTLDDADHLLTRPEDSEYAAGVISAWAQRYLKLTPPAPPPGAPEGVVRVTEADPDGYLQDVNAGPVHHALADEPIAYGGTNRGMSPYGFLSAGLGACSSMTVRMYARRKRWPLTSVRVDVTHDKVHAQDAETGAAQKIDTFYRKIYFEGDLDDAQRARLLEIADKCPVHKTLLHSSRIETTLVDD